MNNLLKILTSFFIVVGLNADQGQLSGITPETSTFATGSGIVDMAVVGNNLYTVSGTSGETVEIENANVHMRQGMLELSNVKLVNEMVDLITAQRAYEANSKAISTTDQMLTIVNQLKR